MINFACPLPYPATFRPLRAGLADPRRPCAGPVCTYFSITIEGHPGPWSKGETVCQQAPAMLCLQALNHDS